MAVMTSRERMLTALNNGRPDRLPCQVHNWMPYYLQNYLDGIDDWAAYERFGMDFAIYMVPDYIMDPMDCAKWEALRLDTSTNENGVTTWRDEIRTPKGSLYYTGALNAYTSWTVEPLIKTAEDFELFRDFFPQPIGVDFTKMRQAKERLGDRGILRSFPFMYGQGSVWQSLCILMETQPAIMLALQNPSLVHEMLATLEAICNRGFELWNGQNPADLIETGGGAGSNTVISPTLFQTFCLPYDTRQHLTIREQHSKSVYHLCGGIMQMLELVTQNHADGLETMTPQTMGGDCNLKEASRRVGDKLFFVGGFDQNAGFEHGTPQTTRQLVFDCFEATRDHAGYIIAPSDHFFHGDPACLEAFAQAAKECIY